MLFGRFKTLPSSAKGVLARLPAPRRPVRRLVHRHPVLRSAAAR